MTICNAIRMVVEARQRHRTPKTQLQALKQEFDERHADLIEEETLSKEWVAEVETTLRALAVDIFRRTAQKTVHPGVKIRDETQLTYDPNHALEWAIEHRMALTLDGKHLRRSPKQLRCRFSGSQ